MEKKKKVFISADIEGVNGIVNWAETEPGDQYEYFRHQMTEEVKYACMGAHEAGYEVYVKDAHDSARNLIIDELPEYVTIHRGWQGSPCSMMAGLTKEFDAVMFIGYHSQSRSSGNSLSHTMTTSLFQVTINGEIASEFLINSLYASYLGVPVAFLSGDENLTKQVKEKNSNIETVATKKGMFGAVESKHPSVTNKEIKETVFKALSKDLSNNIVKLDSEFDITVQYKNHISAYNNSFFPGCKMIESDKISYHAKDYYDALIMMKFTL